MKTLFFVLVAILQVVIALIPSLGKLFKENEEPYSFKPTLLGKSLVFFSILSLSFILGLYLISEDEEESNQNNLKNELAKRDLISQSLIIQNKDETIEALAKYGLKYDSAERRIEKLVKDSSKSVTNKIEAQPIPHFSICAGDTSIRIKELSNNKIKFQFTFCGYNNIAQKVKSTVYVIGAKEGKYHLLKIQEVLLNLNVTINEVIDAELIVENSNDINIFFFFIENEYEDYLDKKLTNTQVLQFIRAINKFGISSPIFNSQIREFLNKKNE